MARSVFPVQILLCGVSLTVAWDSWSSPTSHALDEPRHGRRCVRARHRGEAQAAYPPTNTVLAPFAGEKGIALPAALLHFLGRMAGHKKSLKGQLLLDGGKLGGSFFHRTVILICEHDAQGAFGLVLNRYAGPKVGEALVADLPEAIKEQPLFIGGPVQPQALSYLHTDLFLPDGNVMANLSVGHALEELQDLASAFSSTQRLKVFAGYAGWSPGQLDDEMRRETWLTHPASVELIYHPEPENLWRHILRLKGVEYRLLAEAPEDPSLN